MRTIKARINLFIFASLVSTFIFAGQAYQANRSQEQVQGQITHSLLMRDQVQNLNFKKKNQELVKKLRAHKSVIPQEDRLLALSNVIQAYNSVNPRLLSKRIDEFQVEEKKFFKVAQWASTKYKNESQFYVLIAGLIPLISILGLTYYFNFGVLSPLHSLSNRMMEFLLDQYTFRFSSPPDNEVGNLERTFNSLAQKVLNNLDELHALDRAKSEFVSIASHELRTPLTSIKGSLGLLSSEIAGQLDNEAKELVLVAEQETDRLVRLINDMLDLAKIESRSLTLKKEWMTMQELFEKTIAGLQGFALASQVKVKILDGRPDIEVNIDADRIQQILTNLISNAIKYSPLMGSVTLSCLVTGSRDLEISVTDQGPGISDDNQKLIFQKFRQATDSSNHLVKGTGLGLAISKALIEEHQGTIGVRSTSGQGSTFYFTLSEWRELKDSHQQSNKVA